MAGLFGFIVSGVQTLALEREALSEVEWTPSIVLFILGYALRYIALSTLLSALQSTVVSLCRGFVTREFVSLY